MRVTRARGNRDRDSLVVPLSTASKPRVEDTGTTGAQDCLENQNVATETETKMNTYDFGIGPQAHEWIHKQTSLIQAVEQSLLYFLGHATATTTTRTNVLTRRAEAFYTALQDLATTMSASPLFQSHEIIGSSVLLCYDLMPNNEENVSVKWIDFSHVSEKKKNDKGGKGGGCEEGEEGDEGDEGGEDAEEIGPDGVLDGVQNLADLFKKIAKEH